jgi:hypothetical protein
MARTYFAGASSAPQVRARSLRTIEEDHLFAQGSQVRRRPESIAEAISAPVPLQSADPK